MAGENLRVEDLLLGSSGQPRQPLWVPLSARQAAATQQTTPPVVQWVLDDAGRPELDGWESREIGDLALLSCPLCGCTVLDDDGLLRRHEEWHARTDFPVSDDLAG